MALRATWLAALLATACATAPAPSRDCAAWYRELDAQVERGGVRDAQARPVADHPYLRVNRLLAALREDAATSDPKARALVARMQALEVEGRELELANLGMPAAEARAVLGRARECGARLSEADVSDPAARARLLERAGVADDYSTAARFFGIYALTRYPFFAGVRDYQDGVRETFRTESGHAARRYAPPGSPTMPRAEQAAALARASANPLGIPEPRGEALERLFAAHAPVFEIEQTGSYDWPGALRWTRGAHVPAVDAADPVVYRMAARTRYRGRVLLQLVYTIWFSERPADSPFDLLSGALDGIVWRVTLAPDGEPLVYDAMHPCGCYHMFFPTPRARPLAPPASVLEWAFSPRSLPRAAQDERPVLRVPTRTHYLKGVTFSRDTGAGTRYALRSYDELRSMPRPGGGRASAFGPDGIIEGTERAERFFFWPMGVASPGAMRQWGRHATAFVGRRHFDDADLLEKRFVLELR